MKNKLVNMLFLGANLSFQESDRKGLESIQNLDLLKVKLKLSRPSHGSDGWTSEQVEEAEKWYKRFLALIHLRPGKQRVPNGVVDEFWHQHMLDSRAYFKDSDAIFGRYLHHNPYFGIGAEIGKGDDRQHHQKCYDETKNDLCELFNEDFTVLEGLFPNMASQGFDCCTDCNDYRTGSPVEDRFFAYDAVDVRVGIS